jgi:hypothetical protein
VQNAVSGTIGITEASKNGSYYKDGAVKMKEIQKIEKGQFKFMT